MFQKVFILFILIFFSILSSTTYVLIEATPENIAKYEEIEEMQKQW